MILKCAHIQLFVQFLMEVTAYYSLAIVYY